VTVASRVLIVDGHEPDVRLMRDALAPHGFDVEVATDPSHVFDTIERTRPDVVLLEVAGPGTAGMDLLDRIRASPHLASTPVVIVTTRRRDDDVLAGYKFGADYYLTKPVTVRRLLRGIGLVLGREFPE
jgi:two-component system alkaline phosphatase synthesis response regulator PhoP